MTRVEYCCTQQQREARGRAGNKKRSHLIILRNRYYYGSSYTLVWLHVLCKRKKKHIKTTFMNLRKQQQE